MNKPSKCKDIYFSDDHRYMLYAAAEKTLKMKAYGTLVDLNDLVNIGWLRCLRRLPKKKLKGCFTILYQIMEQYYFEYAQDHSIFIHKQHFKNKKQTPLETIQNREDYKSLYTQQIPYVDPSQKIDAIFSLNINPKHLEVLKYFYLEEKTNSETAALMDCPEKHIPLLKWEAIVAIQQKLHINVIEKER